LPELGTGVELLRVVVRFVNDLIDLAEELGADGRGTGLGGVEGGDVGGSGEHVRRAESAVKELRICGEVSISG